MKDRYRVADLAFELDEKGEVIKYWVSTPGWQPSKIGSEFGMASVGVDSLYEACKLLKSKLLLNKEQIVEEINMRLKNKEE